MSWIEEKSCPSCGSVVLKKAGLVLLGSVEEEMGWVLLALVSCLDQDGL